MKSRGLKKKKDGRMIFFCNGSMHGFLEEEDGNLIKKHTCRKFQVFFPPFLFLKFWSSSPFFVSSHKFVIPNCWFSSHFFVSFHKFVIPKVGVAFFHVN